MVLGQLLQKILTETVEAAVADMDVMAGAPRQNQGGEGRRHADAFGIDAALGDDPGIDRVERMGRGLSHAQRTGQGKIAVEEGAHAEFRGLTPAGMAANPVGDHRDHVGARIHTRPAEARRAKILIVRPPAALADKADFATQFVVEAGHGATWVAG